MCLNDPKKWRKTACALYTVQYVLSNPKILLLTSRGLARKVQKLVFTLNLTQEPKNAMRLREVRLQKGLRGWGLMNFLIKGAHLAVAYIENVQSSKMTPPTVYGIIHKDINIFLKYTVSLTGRHGLHLGSFLMFLHTYLYISFVYCLVLTIHKFWESF